MTFPKLHDLIDKDRNGNISRKEFTDFFRDKINIELAPKEISIAMNHFDKNRNDLISVDEFVQGLKDAGRTSSFNYKTEYKKLYNEE
jgi:Ca2+-binding EF-hand superfamily protein